MYRFIKLLILLAVVVMTACTETVDNAEAVGRQPSIYPDYKDVTIPADIAPMNFNIAGDKADLVDVVVTGAGGETVHTQGGYADFDTDEWHEIVKKNKGGKLTFTVCVKRDGRWYRYDDFVMYVSPYDLQAWGITYRRIPPGYEVGGNIGIYQRDISTFDEFPILAESAVPGQCMNCHVANKTSSATYNMQVRGSHGGTMIVDKGKMRWINTKTDSTKANTSYAYWHPSGDYSAFSTNKIYQSFFVGTGRRIEVFDTFSDVLVYDMKSNKLILSPLLMTDDWETYPAFSADGRTLFFCKSKHYRVPAEYDKVKYSLCKISFDAANGSYGEKIDTIIDASVTGKSYTYPRPSYDGRWLLYSVTDFGNFPVNHSEADLWMMDLKTGGTRALDEINSRDSESYHSWSADSHWIVFGSRRENGVYTQPFITSVDDKGRCTKPFLLPQKNPWEYYHATFDSFNCPDFTDAKVDFDAGEAKRLIMSGAPENVSIR